MKFTVNKLDQYCLRAVVKLVTDPSRRADRTLESAAGGTIRYAEVGVASSHGTVGPRDHHVLAPQAGLAFSPNAGLEMFSDAGHYPMVETPVAPATSIEEFLGRE